MPHGGGGGEGVLTQLPHWCKSCCAQVWCLCVVQSWWEAGQSLEMYEVGLKVKKAAMWCRENSICFLQQELERRSGQSASACGEQRLDTGNSV